MAQAVCSVCHAPGHAFTSAEGLRDETPFVLERMRQSGRGAVQGDSIQSLGRMWAALPAGLDGLPPGESCQAEQGDKSPAKGQGIG